MNCNQAALAEKTQSSLATLSGVRWPTLHRWTQSNRAPETVGHYDPK